MQEIKKQINRLMATDSWENRTEGYYNDDGMGFLPTDAMERSGV